MQITAIKIELGKIFYRVPCLYLSVLSITVDLQLTSLGGLFPKTNWTREKYNVEIVCYGALLPRV